MKLKKKIIKWLGGYTEDELLSLPKIVKVEKQFIPIKAQYIIRDFDEMDFAKAALANKIVDAMRDQYIKFTYHEDIFTEDIVVEATSYVREI